MNVCMCVGTYILRFLLSHLFGEFTIIINSCFNVGMVVLTFLNQMIFINSEHSAAYGTLERLYGA